MKCLAVAAVLCLSVPSAGWAQAPAAPARGQQVFAEQKCSKCHSVAGVGNKKGVLDGIGSRLTAAQIRTWITTAPAMAEKAQAHRKPAMKAPALPAADLDALVAYLQTLKRS